MKGKPILIFILCLIPQFPFAQPATSSGTPYATTTPAEVKQVLDRVLKHIEQATPFEIVNRVTGEKITNFQKPIKEATLAKGAYAIYTH